MFDLPAQADAARRASKLAGIYHQGQKLAWDGRDVLGDLLAKHGRIELPPAQKAALGRVFSLILWGELAAWKISAQLADQLVPLEAKMAATGQAHDEARHFYVMHDYLAALGATPQGIDKPARVALDMILGTDSLLEKMTGMQLLVEPFALTVFQLVRETEIEPVLSELLRYYERDEARHVGLGVQHLPLIMQRASKYENARTLWFQFKVMAWTLRGMRELAPDFQALGIDPRDVLLVGRNKVFTATEMLWAGMGIERPPSRRTLEPGVDAMSAILFPEPSQEAWPSRLRTAKSIWQSGGFDAETVEL